MIALTMAKDLLHLLRAQSRWRGEPPVCEPCLGELITVLGLLKICMSVEKVLRSAPAKSEKLGLVLAVQQQFCHQSRRLQRRIESLTSRWMLVCMLVVCVSEKLGWPSRKCRETGERVCSSDAGTQSRLRRSTACCRKKKDESTTSMTQ